MLEKQEPAGEFLGFFWLGRGHLHLLHNCDEHAHDVRKAGDAKEQHQAHDQTLDLTLWVEVAETDCRECREHKVDDDRGDFHGRVIVKLILVDETVHAIFARMLRDDVPEGAEEVREEENDADDAEDLEAFAQVNLLHDLVVVRHSVVADVASTVLIKHLFQVITVAVAN